MKIKQVYDTLVAELGGWLAANGYQKKTGTRRLLWSRPHGRQYKLIHFFGDKYPYQRPLGGKFGMKAVLSSKPVMTDDSWNEAYCLMDLLNRRALRQMTALRDEVIHKVLGQKPEEMTSYEKLLFDSFGGLLELELEQPYRKGCEEYLPYLDAEDVVAWCRFIEGVLPTVDGGVVKPRGG